MLADDLTGEELPGRFRLDGVLATGTFGTVYRARQLAVDRDVAVKVLHSDIDPASEDGRLFVHEIKSVGRIDHANVVRIHQADVAPGGRLFFAMELLDGSDLQELIDRDGVMEPARALGIVDQLLAGLAAAHDAGLVHADIKPGNAIVVGQPPRERVVLVDFGLSRLRAHGQPAESVGGTPAYMAPEQLRDGQVDARSDLFAIALVLVTLLTGWRRREADQLVPPLDGIADPALRAVLAKALAIDPAARYQTAAELARALAGDAAARSPFRYLAPFTERDAGRLHGRDRDLAALVEQVGVRRVTVYSAPSGTGKTSLLRAGLVPRLTALGARAVYLAARPDSGAALGAAIDGWRGGGGERLVVVLDQLELELTGGAGRPALVAQALDVEHPDVALILSVREDFLGRLLAADPRLQAGVPVLRLPPLDRAGARAAITEALAEHHIAIDPALLDTLLADLLAAGAAIAPELGWGTGPAVYPPHLQLACSVLHDALEPGADRLTLAHYRRLGGFDAIVGEQLERVLESELDATASRIARDLFVALVTAAHTRAHRSEAELVELDGGRHGEAAVRAVLESLAGRGLLVRVRGGDGEPGWELVHDSLVPRVEAWLDRRDLSRRRAVEMLRHHLRRSSADRPSLLGRDELRELRGHADAIAELEAEWRRRGAAWTPASLLERSRAVLRRRRAVIAAAVALAVTASAVAVARWWIERDRRLHEQSLRDRDLGRFTLELRAFDWDDAARRAVPVPVDELGALAWRLHQPGPDDPGRPGELIASPFLVRHPGSRTVEDGARSELVEASGGQAVLVIDGRGRGGDRCPPSIIPLRQLPGYARRGDEPWRLRISVPTCQATRVGTIDVPAGPFMRGGPGSPPSAFYAQSSESRPPRELDLPAFAIDRTEVTNAAFAAFGAMSDVTGIAMPDYFDSPSLRDASGPGFPVAGITWNEARAYCRFLGKELPTSEQWEKAMRGGLTLPDGTVNPVPDRNLPWGSAIAVHANVRDTGDHRPAPVGSFPGDVSPYGVVDLAGNVQEWTDSMQVISGESYDAWRITRGANWDDADVATLVDYVWMENPRRIGSSTFALGVRCVLPRP